MALHSLLIANNLPNTLPSSHIPFVPISKLPKIPTRKSLSLFYSNKCILREDNSVNDIYYSPTGARGSTKYKKVQIRDRVGEWVRMSLYRLKGLIVKPHYSQSTKNLKHVLHSNPLLLFTSGEIIYRFRMLRLTYCGM